MIVLQAFPAIVLQPEDTKCQTIYSFHYINQQKYLHPYGNIMMQE